jgi:hypothetical protein
MKRLFGYLKFVAIPFVLTTMVFGQEHVDIEKRPIPETLGKDSNSVTSDQDLADISVAILAKTTEELGKVLEKTERINVVCGDYQVIFPLPNDVKPFPFAERFLQFCEFWPDTKIHQGKSSLLIEPRPGQEIQILRTTTKLLFGLNPDRKWLTRSPADIHNLIAPDGLPATKVQPEVSSVGRILVSVKTISLSLGVYNIIVPVRETPSCQRTAQRIIDLCQTYPELEVFDVRKSLLIETALQIAPDVVVALVEELLPSKTDEKTQTVTKSEVEDRNADDFLVDTPMFDVFADAVSIESILKETKAISVRFGGHQITMRISPSGVDDDRFSVLAKVVESFRKSTNQAASRSRSSDGFSLKLGNKKTALLVSMPAGESSVEFVRAIVGALFTGQKRIPEEKDPNKASDSSSTSDPTTDNSTRNVARINLGMRHGKRNSDCDMIVFYSQESDTEKLFDIINEKIDSNIYPSMNRLRLASSNGGLLLSCPVSLAVAVTEQIAEGLREDAVTRHQGVPPQRDEANAKRRVSGVNGASSESNPYHATLLILKADFKSPTSYELNMEMEEEFGKLNLKEGLREAFKATNGKSVVGALIPPQTVACFTPQHATAFLRWLAKHQLIEAYDVGMPGVLREQGAKGNPTPISKDGFVISDHKKLLPIDAHLAPNLGPFVKFTQQFDWFMQMVESKNGLTQIQSSVFISTNEQQPSGQALNSIKLHGISRFELPDEMVAFVSGFAHGTEQNTNANRGSLEYLQAYASRRGFEPVIVIFRDQGLYDVPAAFHVPDLIKPLSGSWKFGTDGGRSENQFNLASQVFDGRQVLLGINNTEIPVALMPTTENVAPQQTTRAQLKQEIATTKRSADPESPTDTVGSPLDIERRREPDIERRREHIERRRKPPVASDQAKSIIDEPYQSPVSHQRTTSTEDLKRRCEAKENSTIEIARRIQSNPGRAGDDEVALRQAVAETFDLRQQLHQAELAEFQQRMETIRQKIQTREQNKDQMIKRRIEDLLNPNLKWDTSNARRKGNKDSVSVLSAAMIKPRKSLADADARLQAQIARLERWRDDTLRIREETARLGDPTSNKRVKRSDWPVPFRQSTEDESHHPQEVAPFVDTPTDSVKQRTVARLQKLGVALRLYEELFGRFPSAAGPGIVGQGTVAASRSVKNIALYEEVFGRIPSIAGHGAMAQGTVPVSWRVMILPFLGEPTLYNKYNFNEPWDSINNKEILNSMPRVFRSPLDSADSTNTSFFGFVTPEYQPEPNGIDLNPFADNANTSFGRKTELTFFSNPIGTAIQEITDEPKNTIAIIEAKRATPWTKPDDIPYSHDKPFPVMEGWFPDGWHVAFADGTVRQLSSKIDESTLRALLTIGGGEECEPKFVDEPKRETSNLEIY